jgi:hypothetical protein
MVAAVSIGVAVFPLVFFGISFPILYAARYVQNAMLPDTIAGAEAGKRSGVSERERRRIRRQIRVCTRHIFWTRMVPTIVVVLGSFLGAMAIVPYVRPDVEPDTWSCCWRALFLWVPAVFVMIYPLNLLSDYTMPKRHRETWRRLRRRVL